MPNEPVKRRLLVNPMLGTVFADSLVVNSREDGTVMLQCLSQVGDGAFEQARIVMTKEHVKRLADLLCRCTDHYPVREPAAETPK